MLDIYDNEAIIDKVNRLCKERRWTPYKLAKKANLPKGTLYTWLRRKTSPSIALLGAISDAFGISLVTFLLDDEDYGELTEEQREFITEINSLPKESRKILFEFITKFKSEN